MLVEFTCERCGAKFTRERDRRGGKPPRVCEACKAARRHDYMAAFKDRERKRKQAEEMFMRAAARPVNPAKIVKKCRRCGKVFEDKRLRPYKMPNSDEGFVEHRYCPSCSWKMKRAARACDPRYVGVGGHGDVLEAGR